MLMAAAVVMVEVGIIIIIIIIIIVVVVLDSEKLAGPISQPSPTPRSNSGAQLSIDLCWNSPALTGRPYILCFFKCTYTLFF